jgi:hypothetical protein
MAILDPPMADMAAPPPPDTAALPPDTVVTAMTKIDLTTVTIMVTEVPMVDIVNAPTHMDNQVMEEAMADMVVATVNLPMAATLSRELSTPAHMITAKPTLDMVKTDTEVATILKLMVATKTLMIKNTTTNLMVLMVYLVLRVNHLSTDFKAHMDRRNFLVLRDLMLANLSTVVKVFKDTKIFMV